jgi:AbrB family looped-hinge helix DNA binding protein
MDVVITIDAAGRLVLPKALRDRHGLRPGSELVVRDDGAEIHIRPVADGPPLREVNGFLVLTGASPSSVQEIENDREDRLRLLAGR